MNSNGETSRTLPSDSQETTTAAAYPTPPNSPPRTKCDLPEDAKDLGKEDSLASTNSTNETVQLETSDLKVSFGIDGWRCGGLTLDGKPCRRHIPENRRHDINIHIESMIRLHQSSPQLQAKLEKLVDLVHCHQHKRGYEKLSRLDKWTAFFPSESDQASHDMLVERKIGLSFGRLTSQCIGISRKKQQFKMRIGGRNVQNRTKTLKEISKTEVYLNEDNLNYALKELELNMFCTHHTNQRSSERLTSWKKRIVDIIHEMECRVPGHLKESNATESHERQVSQQTSPPTRNGLSKQRDISSSKDSNQEWTPPFTDSNKRVAYMSDTYDTSPFDIVERSIPQDDYKASYNEIEDLMKKRLDNDKDQKMGHIYAYEVEGNKGFVKIGYTTHSVEKRHKEWCFDCNRQPIPLFPKSADKAALVPNARRVEALCHAELRHRQIIIYCDGCLKTHEEWFKVTPEKAIAVIKKWTAWMMKEPYTPDH